MTGNRPAARRPAAWGFGLTLVVLVCLVLPAVSPSLTAPELPALSGRVVDLADLIPAAAESALTEQLAALESKSTDQLVVVTVPSLQGYSIEDFGYELGKAWKIGQQDKDNGVILLVAPNEREVRIEVGKGLEPIITDALASIIIQSTILPRFRRGEFAEGLLAGAQDLNDALLGDAEEVAVRARGGVREQSFDWIELLPIALWIAIVLFIMWQVYRAQRMAPKSARYGRRRGKDVVIAPGGWGGSGNWSGGSWSGGSSGGGFGGGGGGFGGGGASGGW